MTSLPARGRLGPNRIEQSVRRTGLGVRVLLILKALDDRVDDAALMAAVAADADRDAFAVVFRRYASKVKAHLVARGVAAGVKVSGAWPLTMVVQSYQAALGAIPPGPRAEPGSGAYRCTTEMGLR